MCKPALLLLALTPFCFTSCHFGRSAEEIMNEYSDVERTIEFRFQSPTPGGSTRVNMEDLGLDGISARWEGDESIALFDFGEVFTEPTNAIKLGYDKDEDDVEGIDFASFTGEAKAKMGENVFDGKNFALMFPYKSFADKPATSTSVNLDFTGQDGTLLVLRKNFLYAWGGAYGECEDAVVTLLENQGGCSSNQDWHSHVTGSEDIVLDNKMSIIRFSMIAGNITPNGTTNDTTWECLTSYLKARNLKIDEVVVKSDSLSTPFSQASVDLRSGQVRSGENSIYQLSVKPVSSNSWKEIEEKDATPVSKAVDAEKVAWGTTFYLSVPCTLLGSLSFMPTLTINTRNITTGEPGTTYYGALSYKRLKEGDYYMTAPIKVFDSMVKVQEEAQIYLYYHSSFVFDVDDIY